jgi:hypothetical protein
VLLAVANMVLLALLVLWLLPEEALAGAILAGAAAAACLRRAAG